MIVFDKFFKLLKQINITASSLAANKVVSTSIITKMRYNKPISAYCISKLCNYLKCQPCDIMEHL